METSLHRTLKESYGPSAGGHQEVSLHGFRIDAVSADGELVEIQSAALGPLRTKLTRLLPGARVRVVKPVVVEKRVVRRSRRDGQDLGSRLSPRRGAIVDVFDDLIGLARVFPHPNLVIEVLAVEIDEVRVPCRRRPGYVVVDRALRHVVDRVTLRSAADLWRLLPDGCGDTPFTTRALAARLDRPLACAQRVAYCLRLSRAATAAGKIGNAKIYERDFKLAPSSRAFRRADVECPPDVIVQTTSRR